MGETSRSQSDSRPDVIEEEPSESTVSHLEGEEEDHTRKGSSMELQGSSSASNDGTVVSEEEMKQLRNDLQKSLQEEQMLLSLQMQLLLQLEKMNTSIALAESEDRLAKLALQQAQVARAMKKSRNPDAKVEDETITIQLRS